MLVLTTQEAGQAGDKLSHLQKVGVLKDGTGRGHAGLEFRQGPARLEAFQKQVVLHSFYFLISIKSLEITDTMFDIFQSAFGLEEMTLEKLHIFKQKASVFLIPRRHGKTWIVVAIISLILSNLSNVQIGYVAHQKHVASAVFTEIIDTLTKSFDSKRVEVNKETSTITFRHRSAVKTVEELQDITPSEIIPLGRGGAWYAEGALYMFFVNMDMLMCCPNMPTFPSLTHFINLLTRCDNGECVTCYGAGAHVNILRGWTEDDSPGTSGTCPCLLPCTALNNDYVPITGHRALLGLMFKPEDAPFVVGLRFNPPKMHPDMSRVLQGVLANGKEVPCTAQPWTLLRFSDLYSRAMLYNCQVLKRQVLHSY